MKGINFIKLGAAYPDQEFSEELVQDFLRQLPQAAEKIIHYYDKKSYTELSQHAHALRGAACFVYAEQLSLILKEIEAKITHNQTRYLATLINTFKREVDLILLPQET